MHNKGLDVTIPSVNGARNGKRVANFGGGTPLWIKEMENGFAGKLGGRSHRHHSKRKQEEHNRPKSGLEKTPNCLTPREPSVLGTSPE